MCGRAIGRKEEVKLTAKSGAKSKYVTLKVAEKLDTVRGWAMHGGKAAVAEALGVAKSTVSGWAGKYPEFAEAVAKGIKESNGEILNSAFDQSRGYYREVTELIKVRKQRVDPITGKLLTDEEVEEHTYLKYFPPDPRMTQFMVTNRLPEEYRKAPTPKEEGENKFEFYFNTPGVTEGQK